MTKRQTEDADGGASEAIEILAAGVTETSGGGTGSAEGDAASQETLQETAKRNTMIYCGPNVPKLNVLTMSVFRGGLPGQMTRLMEKIPGAGGLIVPVERLSETKLASETPGTEEHRLYRAVLAAREGV